MATQHELQKEGKILGWTLRLGSYGSVGLIVLGMALSFVHAGVGQGFLRAGFLLLMFTPAFRIMVAGVVFLREKDYHYALVSAVVLTVVVLTSVLALAGILPQLEK
jgi:uncharacterized membrane protein